MLQMATNSVPTVTAISDCLRVGQRVSQNAVMPRVNSTPSTPRASRASTDQPSPATKLSVTSEADPETVAITNWVERRKPRWRRNWVTHSKWSGSSHQR